MGPAIAEMEAAIDRLRSKLVSDEDVPELTVTWLCGQIAGLQRAITIVEEVNR